jgi:hypothetical protein
MKTTTLALIACLLGTAAASGPDTLWVTTVDLGGDETGNGIAFRDSAIAITGNAWSGYSSDLLTLRLDQNGDTEWVRRYDAGAGEYAWSTCMDAQSNILVAGYGDTYRTTPRGTLSHRDFRPWCGLPADSSDIYSLVMEYDPSGVRKWIRTSPGCQAFAIASDSAGNCYAFGGIKVTDTTQDLWLTKISPLGESLWAKVYHSAPAAMGFRLAMDPSGNLVGCAQAGTMDNMDWLTLKFTPDGDTIWTRRYDVTSWDCCYGIASDPFGNIIVVGYTSPDTTTLALVLKYDSNGNLLWSTPFRLGSQNGLGGASCDSAGDIYVAGYTGSQTDQSCLTMKLDSAGHVLWLTTYGSLGYNTASDVACDNDGNPIVAGYVMNSMGNGDVLALKYSALTGITESHAVPSTPARATTTITAAPDFVLSVPSSGHYDIRLCDLTGRTRQQLFRGTLIKGAHRLSASALPAGMYVVRVAAPDGGVSCQRLVLVK